MYATGDCMHNKPGIKKQKGHSVAWSNYAHNVAVYVKYFCFFLFYNVRTYWTIVLNVFSEPLLMHFTKALVIHVFKTGLWVYFGREYVNNIFPLLYVRVKFGLSNWANCVDSGAIQVSCLSLRSHWKTSCSWTYILWLWLHKFRSNIYIYAS